MVYIDQATPRNFKGGWYVCILCIALDWVRLCPPPISRVLDLGSRVSSVLLKDNGRNNMVPLHAVRELYTRITFRTLVVDYSNGPVLLIRVTVSSPLWTQRGGNLFCFMADL